MIPILKWVKRDKEVEIKTAFVKAAGIQDEPVEPIVAMTEKEA